MLLLSITRDDLPLYESLHCDPKMTEHLGGPQPKERMPEKLQRDVESIEAGRAWIFKVIPDSDSGRVAGSVCIWESSRLGESFSEIGWAILPAFQGQGLGSKAVRAILDKALAEGRWGVIHAYPATTNPSSNAICRKMGFSKLEEVDLEHAGHLLRCNHWRLDPQ